MELILASNSPRRKSLLTEITPDFKVIPSEYDEETLKSTIASPEELVKRLSYEKANEVFLKHFYGQKKDCAIIGSDTLVVLNDKILGKPKDKQDAFSMLSQLQGKANHVLTATTVILQRKDTVVTTTTLSDNTVQFKPMSKEEISSYIATKEPLDKAGAYAIQGIGKQYIKGYEGDFNAIVGLDTTNLKKIFETYHILS